MNAEWAHLPRPDRLTGHSTGGGGGAMYRARAASGWGRGGGVIALGGWGHLTLVGEGCYLQMGGEGGDGNI